MKFLSTPIACAALAIAVPASAQELAVEHAAANAKAERLGEKIYRYDQAAWHATDAMLEAIDDPAALGIVGWIVNPVEGGHEVVFYRPTETGFEAVWSGLYDGSRVDNAKSYIAGERALTASEAAMVRAIDAPFKVETDYSLCSERINRVIFPTGKPDGGFYVYLLAPQPASDQIPLGGHFRFEVVDGEVVDHRKFTNSCVTLPTSSKEGGDPAALTISHVLDETPTEIHVFSMFAARIPVYVITTPNQKVWAVDARDGTASIRSVEK